MSKLEQIESAVASLSDEELRDFANWFDDLRWQRWDRRIEEDAASGKLDVLRAEAQAEITAGRTRPL
jgi:hypothetical protein